MSSPVIELTNFSLTSRVQKNTNGNYLFQRGCKFILPSCGVYTLEGDNQAGKSTLIKLIMGALPASNGQPNKKVRLSLDGIPIEIGNVSDAKKVGLAAVFQDDILIPSLTVAQQLALVHAKHNPIFERLFSQGHTEATGKKLTAKQIVEKAEKLLLEYGETYSPILHKYPTQLSGGALAVAKLVRAQLQSNIKVLFLDEAFSGVQRDIWPTLIDKLRAWSEMHSITIVAVTHLEEEITRWQPKQRLVISNGVIDYFD